MPAFLVPILTKIVVDLIKKVLDQGKSQVPDIANKVVATAVAALMTWGTQAKLPVDLGPVLNQYAPIVVAALSSWGAMILHDLADLLAQKAGNNVN